MPLEGYAVRLWPTDNDLQSLSSMGRAGSLAGFVSGLGDCFARWHSDDRQHDRQGSSFCRWRKRGAEAQAIGRSRGGRTTKIHAAADGCGRPIAIEITPGQLGDVRAALAVLSACPKARLCAADTAYDSNGLRQFLTRSETSFPTIPPESKSIRSTHKPTNSEISSNACSAVSKTGDASPPATISSQQITQPPSISPQS